MGFKAYSRGQEVRLRVQDFGPKGQLAVFCNSLGLDVRTFSTVVITVVSIDELQGDDVVGAIER